MGREKIACTVVCDGCSTLYGKISFMQPSGGWLKALLWSCIELVELGTALWSGVSIDSDLSQWLVKNELLVSEVSDEFQLIGSCFYKILKCISN